MTCSRMRGAMHMQVLLGFFSLLLTLRLNYLTHFSSSSLSVGRTPSMLALRPWTSQHAISSVARRDRMAQVAL